MSPCPPVPLSSHLLHEVEVAVRAAAVRNAHVDRDKDGPYVEGDGEKLARLPYLQLHPIVPEKEGGRRKEEGGESHLYEYAAHRTPPHTVHRTPHTVHRTPYTVHRTLCTSYRFTSCLHTRMPMNFPSVPLSSGQLMAWSRKIWESESTTRKRVREIPSTHRNSAWPCAR